MFGELNKTRYEKRNKIPRIADERQRRFCMGVIKDISGSCFGKLKVISLHGVINRRTFWKCQCECGNIKNCNGTDLRSDKIKSCGCVRISKHNSTGTRLYNIWKGMKSRCYIKTSKSFNNYGARGIKLCDEWINDFSKFKEWSLINNYNDQLSIERIDNNGNYDPNNCKWIPINEQNKNRRVRKKYPNRNKYGTFRKN